MRNCDEIVELISASLDGQLTADEQTALNEHIACCPACSALLDDLSALHLAAAELEEVPAPAGFAASVMGVIAAETAQETKSNVIPFAPRKPRRSHWKNWGVTAAAIAIVVMGAVSVPSLQGNFAPKAEADMAPPAAEMSADYALADETHYGAKAQSNNTADIPAEDMKPSAPSAAPETADYVGVLVLEEIPDSLSGYEGVVCSDGTVTYILTADQFDTLLQELEESKPVGYFYTAGNAEAELGKIIVQSTN